MERKFIVSGIDEKPKLPVEEEKRRLRHASDLILYKVMENERENTLLMLSAYKKLRYEDWEEIYSDGCFKLWKKMMEDDAELEEAGMVGYLRKVCWNLGKRYLRKVNDDVVSLEMLMDMSSSKRKKGISEVFDVLDEEGSDNNERLKKLNEIWEKLSVVDRRILECYYVDGCKMEEIATKIGYKSGKSVKSRKNKVLKKLLSLMSEDEEAAETN
jgi:RNA polymerase sigma factor (sigma-70 family)